MITVYIDDDFEAARLSDFLAQVRKYAVDAWGREIEDLVRYSYRDLARAEVRAGRSVPEDHPSIHPSYFASRDSLAAAATLKLWGDRVMEEISRSSPVSTRKDP